eukprot:6478528-Amphidinium_carterae.1
MKAKRLMGYLISHRALEWIFPEQQLSQSRIRIETEDTAVQTQTQRQHGGVRHPLRHTSGNTWRSDSAHDKGIPRSSGNPVGAGACYRQHRMARDHHTTHLRDGDSIITRIPTEYNTADFCTKYLNGDRIKRLVKLAELRFSQANSLESKAREAEPNQWVEGQQQRKKGVTEDQVIRLWANSLPQWITQRRICWKNYLVCTGRKGV